MTTHLERLLLAQSDHQAALEFRAVAEESLKLRERALELHLAVYNEAPLEAVHARDIAWLEKKQLDRICLHHSAQTLDKAWQIAGWESDMASVVAMWDIIEPVSLPG